MSAARRPNSRSRTRSPAPGSGEQPALRARKPQAAGAGKPPRAAAPGRGGRSAPVPKPRPPANADEWEATEAAPRPAAGPHRTAGLNLDEWEPTRAGRPVAARGRKSAPANSELRQPARGARPAPARAGKAAPARAGKSTAAQAELGQPARRPRFEREDLGPGGQRRPLSHVGGRIERLEGPEQLTSVIRRCLSVHPERGVRDHVHGFHSYPARLHPGTAARLIEAFAPPGAQVADPFCGCGTVPIEARRLGRSALGLDLNPLAVRLTRFKAQPLDRAQREALLDAAVRVAEAAEERRTDAAGPTRQYDPDERAEFDVHVLLELDGLAHGIRNEPQGPIRRGLLLALSSIFSKVARQQTVEGGKRLASGFTLRFFVSRVEELTRQLAEYEAMLPAGVVAVQCEEGDARQLDRLGWRNVALVVSSPPYPGVLDYSDYHRTRLRWLGLDGAQLERQELGSRRALQHLDPAAAADRWEQDFTRVLAALARALAPEGLAGLVLADSMLAGQPYPADEVVERCAERAGLRVLARGSQRRPHFHADSAKAFGSRPRYEHLMLLGAAAPAQG